MGARLRVWTLVALGLAAACGSNGEPIEVPQTEVTKTNEEAREGHTLVQYVARQPEFRDRASDGHVDQHINVGVPDGVESDAPVLFALGGEQPPIDEAFVGRIQGQLGIPMIVVDLEHRGYGNSLSDNPDQTTPHYVSRREAAADAHEVARGLQSDSNEYAGNASDRSSTVKTVGRIQAILIVLICSMLVFAAWQML